MPDTAFPAGQSPNSKATPRHQDYHHFVRYVMSDVYALLDFLSGRATPSLAPPRIRSHSVSQFPPRSDGQGGGTVVTLHGEADSVTPQNDHEDPIVQIMAIASKVAKGDDDITAEEARVLVHARDDLNFQAKPATGSSIVFTLRVIDKILHRKNDDDANRRSPRYFIEDEIQDNLALALAKFVKWTIRFMLYGLLSITVILSTYVACGKLLLDTRDQVNKDIQGNITAIAGEMNQSSIAPAWNLMETFCLAANRSTFLVDQSCSQRDKLKLRKQDIHNLLTYWICPWATPTLPDDEKAEQWATTVIGVLGNYLLPILYGALGSLGFVLRRLNRQLADFLLMPRDLRANQIRITLGVVTGACIGLFVNSSVGAATTSGLGGAAVTLTASGIAFLAGYGVEAVFKMLDGLINHVFRIDAERKDIPHA